MFELQLIFQMNDSGWEIALVDLGWLQNVDEYMQPVLDTYSNLQVQRSILIRSPQDCIEEMGVNRWEWNDETHVPRRDRRYLKVNYFVKR